MAKQFPWSRGDWAGCAVHHYSSVGYGDKLMVMGWHWHQGRLVLELLNPRYGGSSSYYAENFINISRGERLDDDIPFDPPPTKEKTMAQRKVHIVLPMGTNDPATAIVEPVPNTRVRQL